MIKRVDLDTFLAEYDPSVHGKIKRLLRERAVSAVVDFVNVCLDSSQLGARTAVIVGPGCTYKSVEDCEGKWLNDLPSRRQYPQRAYVKGGDNSV